MPRLLVAAILYVVEDKPPIQNYFYTDAGAFAADEPGRAWARSWRGDATGAWSLLSVSEPEPEPELIPDVKTGDWKPIGEEARTQTKT